MRSDRRRTSTVRAITLLCALVLLAAACSDDKKSNAAGASTSTNPPPPGQPIKLSILAPVDGVGAQPEIISGAEAAVAAVNDAGGIADPAGGPKRPLSLFKCKLKASDDPEARPLECAKDAIAAGVVADVAKYAFSQGPTKAYQAAGVPLVGTIAVDAEDYTNPNVFMLAGGAMNLAGQGSALQKAGAKTIAFMSADNAAARALPAFLTPVLENKSDLINQT